MGFLISLLRRIIKLVLKDKNLSRHKKNQEVLYYKEPDVLNEDNEKDSKVVEIINATKDSIKAMREQNKKELAEIKIKEAQFSKIIEEKKQEMDKAFEEELLKIQKKNLCMVVLCILICS